MERLPKDLISATFLAAESLRVSGSNSDSGETAARGVPPEGCDLGTVEEYDSPVFRARLIAHFQRARNAAIRERIPRVQ